MGQDATMELFSGTYCFLKCNIYLLLLGTCSTLTLTTPSTTIHGIEGQPLILPVHYNYNTSASGIQIIWLLERSQTVARYLLTSINESVVPDLEFQHKFSLNPPNASLLINSLHLHDEGNYIVKVNIRGSTTVSATQKIAVTVNVPVSKPVIQSEPLYGAVEKVGNMTFKCSVAQGTRVMYQWLKNGKPLQSSPDYTFSLNNDTFIIAPVMKKDIGDYSCLVKNHVSEMKSGVITPTIYYGPYELTVNSDKGFKVGEVFTVDLGEPVQFDCSADSNPPNTFAWIQRANNTTQVINYGPYFKVLSDNVGRKTMDYMCRAYNNVTGNRDETQFTVIITSIAIRWKIQDRRPSTEYRRTQVFSGHEDALNDFGIYEFVSLPDPSVPHRVPSSKSVSVSNSSHAQDMNCTVYEVIQHVPDQSRVVQQE
ncbi:HEPACAM family member 2 isoform X3 [Ascaphus truei]|uniref:HEPACAM family member 2 isoform X3 n=1 Tax=Ascaphus truei TaxID=8439 RepID=UPI003F59329B